MDFSYVSCMILFLQPDRNPSKGMTSQTRNQPRLPACRNCYQKKIKCDSDRPKCQPCTRGNVECMFLDAATQTWISRAYIDELERKEKELSERPPAPAESPEQAPTAGTMASNNTTLDAGGGLSFIYLLFSNPEWRRANADVLRALAQTPRATQESEVPECSLPSNDDGKMLFERYLNTAHVLNPLLLRDEVWALYERVFTTARNGAETGGHTGDVRPHEEQAAATDLFRVFMICATASIIPYQLGAHGQHPEGYYKSAMHNMDKGFLTRGTDSVRDLLLICRFGIYHHIGVSIWDVVRLCGRLLMENELHSDDGEDDAIEAEKKRRSFWIFYHIDRYSATTLDRPFTIEDKDINVPLPTPLPNEEEGELEVFRHCVGLRQITSRIHGELSKLRAELKPDSHHFAVGRIYQVLNRLLQELDVWRAGKPLYEQQRCLYEFPQWFDLLYYRERLSLVRWAIDLVPKSDIIGNTVSPPKYMMALFLQAASELIDGYVFVCHLRSFATHTRSHFHMMFNAGLSLMYCVSVSAWLSQDQLMQCSRCLHVCETSLGTMAEERLPDAYSYVMVFASLRRHIARKIQRELGSTPHEPREGLLPGRDQDGDQMTHFQPPMLDQSGAALLMGLSQQGQTGPDAFQLTPGNGQATPNSGFPGSLGQLLPDQPLSVPLPGEDLLQWAFTSDGSIWDMDTVLGQYAYGDPSGTTLFDGLNFF